MTIASVARESTGATLVMSTVHTRITSARRCELDERDSSVGSGDGRAGALRGRSRHELATRAARGPHTALWQRFHRERRELARGRACCDAGDGKQQRAGCAGARRRQLVRLPRAGTRIASECEARPARRSRLFVDEPGGAGHGARERRLSHRPAVVGRRDDVRRDERVPLFVDEGTGPELRAVSDRRGGGRQPGAPAARRDDALQHAVRLLSGRE